MRTAIYLLYGLLLTGLAGVSEYRGWLLARPTEVRNVPLSLRDNPGAYRSIYRASPRYFGGK